MTKRTAKMAIERLCGDYVKFAKNSDIYANSEEIYYHNLLIAKTYNYGYKNRLFVSLQNFKTEPKLRKAKQDVVKAAVEVGYEIIFVPELDIGFGVNNEHDVTVSNLEKLLVEVAKYSEEDIKTAAVAYMENENGTRKILGLAFNQKDTYEYDNSVIHAEQVLCNYIVDLELYGDEKLRFYSLLEPCEKCLRRMIANQACGIYYFVNHKAKWDTPEYYQLCNDIWNKSILQNYYETPIKYTKLFRIYVDKFMNKEKK